ncbi:putative dna repair protein rad1 [Diplodia seriata]|uniref:Putative dna repair protein rad1 n=1 Tax=Diplodia seriata TaxID=420778 RepID=A0A0G2DXF4_9PEZI|nr:putative dna repair protein rad1 [Diplodia seriata]
MPPGDEKAPVKLSLPLQYQQDIFQDLRNEDQLVILARGLGLLRIVTNLLHAYDAAGNNLVLLVGADDRENGWIGESLAEHAAVSNAPKARGLSLVNTDMMSVGTREKLYSRGGIFSITSRILIVDLLSGLLDPATITGCVVLHADKIVATSLEAFILRIFRQKNKAGFLKAFSDVPEPFATGFSPLATMMRNLFLRKPTLYPRFHVSVAKSLEGRRKAEVIELEVPMTDNMAAIQQAVMECVEVSIIELRKNNSGSLDMEDWTLDSALHRNFDAQIRRQLDPVWHRTSFRTRQIVRDLSLLRHILHALLAYDAVDFNKYLDTVIAASSPPPGSTRMNQSPWLFLDAANTLFETAKRRVYAGKLNDSTTANASNEVPDSLRPVLEELPKWRMLAEVLEEIERDYYFNPVPQDDSSGAILIMCGDHSTSRQLREYLQTMRVRPDEPEENNEDQGERSPSAAFMMRRKLRNYISWKRDFSKVSASLFAENSKVINNDTRSGQSLLTELQPTGEETQQKGEIAADPLENMEDYYELYEMKELLVIHPYDGDMDEHVLEEVRPRSHTDRNVRVYFMYYGGSVEEQRYLSAVRREKDAFSKLILGDYVLTPNICIERKSVRDLISSFNNGRLYNQAETMLQHYKNPMLLIEFDQNKSFTLEPFSDLSQSAAAAAMAAAPDLQAKIVMLTIAFPRLRIIWSSSPYQTAEIFEELKKQQDEPDPVKAVQIGLEEGEDAESKTFNQVPQDMLRAVPGITGNEKMLQRIAFSVGSVFELANMTEQELNELCGREAGRQIFRFFNRDVVDD